MHAPFPSWRRHSRLIWFMLLPLPVLLMGIEQCSEDGDGDGWTEANGDCDDSDPNTHPEAEELCDGKDNDCDDAIDEGLEQTFYRDRDGDGYGTDSQTAIDCEAPEGFVSEDGDCDDLNATVYPSATEVCDSVDNDCNGAIDDEAGPRWYADRDDDSFGDDTVSVYSCTQPESYEPDAGDCDDSDPAINPLATEVCDGLDNNCDGVIDDVGDIPWYYDGDGDGYGISSDVVLSCTQVVGYVLEAGDCDDTDPTISPAAEELCDGIDNNCDGGIDGGAGPAWYPDLDTDAFGDASSPTYACEQPQGQIATGGDCNDADPMINPKAPEQCDGIDNNCDGQVDEGVSSTWYADEDGDGFGTSLEATTGCDQPPGYVLVAGDCNDLDPAIYPGAEEVCDGLDNDCDQAVDEGLDQVWYQDGDGDGFGIEETTLVQCAQPIGYAASSGDCLDADPLSHPGADERCDTLDNDCDGVTDENVRLRWYRDFDGDGFGGVADTTTGCTAPAGFVDQGSDCDDGFDTIYPGAPDPAGDALDQDCGGFDGQQPSVGLEASDYPTIQDAIGAAFDGDTVWVAPGVYLEAAITFGGRTITLQSTHGSSQTTIDAMGLNSVVIFEHGEDANAKLIGFTLTRGDAAQGGGLQIRDSSPTLLDLQLLANSAEDGGGAYFSGSDSALEDSRIEGNTASAYGGGLYAFQGGIQLSRVRCVDNESWYGGGVSISYGDHVLDNVVISGNQGNLGGGMYVTYAALAGDHLEITENGGNSGAGLYTMDVSSIFSNLLVADNVATGNGGGIYANSSSLMDIVQAVITGNSAVEGGGIYLYDASAVVTVHNTILAYNQAFNLWNAPSSSATLELLWSDLYNPEGTASHNLDGLDPSNLELEPDFLGYTSEGIPEAHHLALTSALIDAGAPDTTDSDGTATDLGIFGGPLGAGWDLDGDGYLNYYWPGSLSDAPAGVDTTLFDQYDQDPMAH